MKLRIRGITDTYTCQACPSPVRTYAASSLHYEGDKATVHFFQNICQINKCLTWKQRRRCHHIEHGGIKREGTILSLLLIQTLSLMPLTQN